MYKLTNKQKSPTQVVIKSRYKPQSMTVLNIPGTGSKNNVYYLEDELMTEFVIRAEKKYKLITTQYISMKDLQKGDN